MKNKFNNSSSDNKRYRKFSQPKQNNNIPSKIKYNINQISEIYNSLYEDYFPSILCLSKTSFFEKINKRAKEIISAANQQELQTTSSIALITKIKEDLNKKYENDHKILSTEYQNFLKNRKNYNFLTHFRKHCPQTEKFALHHCPSKKQGKFIIIKTKNKLSNKDEISYAICEECKQCYLSSFILMVCVPCNKKYFSNVLSENENVNILPATWEKYHCGPMINEIMKCIKCKNILYLNLTSKQLVCQNKRCNFVSNPESILWKCFLCSTEFRVGAKIYNPLEFKILKKSINLALIMKKKAGPKQLPCNCEKDPSKLTFFHKEECKGELYKGILIDKEIIVCSKCHAINFEEKFTWICPKCHIKFHLHKIVGCKPFSKKKYIINKHYNQSAKIFSKKNNKGKNEKYMNNISLYNKNTDYEQSIKDSYSNLLKNDFSNQSIQNLNSFYRIEDSESSQIYENKSLFNLKKYIHYSNTGDKKNRNHSTLKEILQERKRSQPKTKLKNITNEEFDSEIENSTKINDCKRLYSNKSTERNKKNYFKYKNRTFGDNNHLKEEQLEKYLKENLQDKTKIINNIKRADNNLKINNNYDIDNEEKEMKIRVNKRFHCKIEPINSNESINENNNKQKDINKAAESTDFSSLKTLSSNDQKSKNNFFNYTTSSSGTTNPLNSFIYRNRKSNTNNDTSKELEAFKSSKMTNQIQDKENSYQDMITNLRFSSKPNMDSYNSSFRISHFINNSTSKDINELIDSSKSNLNEVSEEISEINTTKNNKRIFNLHKNKKDFPIFIKANEEKININEEKETNSFKEKKIYESELINENEKKDKDKNDQSKKGDNKSEEKSENNDDENNDELNDKFEDIQLPFNSKKNVRESFFINTEIMFQNVLISHEKLDSLAAKTNIPPFKESEYNYMRPIGEGTYGIVYLVENKETYEQFALKKIVCRDYNELIKHKNELELIYSVKHEHILNICGIEYKYLDETTSAIYVLMELAQNDWNMEIKRRMLAKKYYKENELIEILKQIIKGFLFLQNNNIAHRDIKPQNILLFPNNIYKIADFGEAKNIKNIAQQSTLRGSELYMSPVLYMGYKFNKKNVIHNPYKSDVFSLGYCLLYAICLNLKVLETLRELTTMRSIISSINKHIMNKYSDKLMNIIYKMIDPNEDERFDFEDLSMELSKNFK